MSFTQTVTAKLSATQRAALAAVERAEGSSVSELVRHALVETYRLDAIAEKMLMAGATFVGEPSEEEGWKQQHDERPMMPTPDEATRRCPHGRAPVRRRDGQQGRCPACGGMLLRLAGTVEHSAPTIEEETAL